MQSAGVPHAGGELFDTAQAAHKWLEILGPDDLPVLKADGLAAGKGVIVPDHIDDAHDAIDQMFAGAFGSAGERVIIEDRLSGMEASAMAIVSGTDVLPLPSAATTNASWTPIRAPTPAAWASTPRPASSPTPTTSSQRSTSPSSSR